MIEHLNLRVAHYKSIGEDPQGIDDILPMNLVIGRNNSGKTALLDLIELSLGHTYATPEMRANFFSHSHSGSEEEVLVTFESPLTAEAIASAFSPTTKLNLPGTPKFTALEFGKSLVGKPATMKIDVRGHLVPYRFSCEFPHKELRDSADSAAKAVRPPFLGFRIGRIAADRDIVPEVVNHLDVLPHGAGITNLFRGFRSDKSLDWEVVSRSLLPDLNRIAGPDALFTEIDVKTDSEARIHEIFLRESGKGLIPLSASGSGLKTVIAVLANLLLLPARYKHPLPKWVFIFEELENNLHPGVLRRLLLYVADKAVREGCLVFLSTHSTVAVDWFFGKGDVQILHVQHDGRQTIVEKIQGRQDVYDALDDLDVRASDMLQANGVVWVEGVSDRIYLERWIELWCAEKQTEVPRIGVDYLLAEYGGKCLSHYGFGCDEESADTESLERLISALALSRNAFVVMDSDKKSKNGKVREVKKRVARQTAAWITKGREVENYLPSDVLTALGAPGLGQYELLSSKLKSAENKKKFALEAAKRINSGNWRRFDLEVQVERLVETIREWSGSASGRVSADFSSQ